MQSAPREFPRCKQRKAGESMRGRRPGNASVLHTFARIATRVILRTMRWLFLALGALTASSVLFLYLYSVNSEFYDPSSFAIGVGGLFAAACGTMLLMIVARRELRDELRNTQQRCEQLIPGRDGAGKHARESGKREYSPGARHRGGLIGARSE